jgi:triacylglycerol lipase
MSIAASRLLCALDMWSFVARAFVVSLVATIAGCGGSNFPDDGDDPPIPGDPRPPDPPPEGPLPPDAVAIILAHGFGGSPDDFAPAIVEAIEADGHAVYRTTVPSVEGVAERAAALAPQIDALVASTGAARVHIIAHSMGGLDARFAISSLDHADRVASLTTLSTPHRGTALADAALGLRGAAAQDDALAVLEELAPGADPEALDRALHDLATSAAPAFDAANPDAAGVAYLSYAGFSTPEAIANPNAEAACAAPPAAVPAPDRMRGALLLAAPIVAEGIARIPNDGVVTVASATWTGFRGCIAADHLDETGTPAAVPPSMDLAAFYRALATTLAGL